MKIPENNNYIMPYLILPDARGFLDFMQAVFGAESLMSVNRDDTDVIMHAELRVGDSTVMYAQANEQFTPQTAGMFIWVEDADATYKKALEHGAESVMGLSDQDYGRTCGVRDGNGNTWWITSPRG